MASKAVLCGLIALLALVTVQAYPHFWVEEDAPSCTAVPTKGAHCHKAPKEDKSVGVTLEDGTGKVVQTVCPGQSYTLKVSFPDDRFSFISLASGKMAVQHASNKKCPNVFAFSKKYGNSPSKSASVRATAPATGPWEINIASATGDCAPFMITKASVPVGKC